MKHFKTSLTSLLCCLLSVSFAQNVTLKGQITFQGSPLQNASIVLKSTSSKEQKGKASNAKGEFEITTVQGIYKLIISAVGMQTIKEDILLNASLTERSFELKEDVLGLDGVVVSATRTAVPLYNLPVVVSTLSAKNFENAQALSLAEGLKFTPGLRTETNCQNCGFNQLRINGLEGAYSQIVINGRGVFSSLAGVYALEMIPANMIERVEVVRGNGSVLYGGSAIGGTVNILTKDPIDNSFSFGNNLSIFKDGTPENTLFANASVVTEKSDAGITVFAFQRNRKGFDANDDGFTEITKLKNTSFGSNLFWNTSENSKLKLNLNVMNEFRRGGNKFNLLPHESDITEQLEHRIIGGDVSFEHFLDGNVQNHKLSYYTSAQHVERNSYYGGGLGEFISVLDNWDTLTSQDKETYDKALRAYGNSKGLTSVAGAQYNFFINSKWDLSAGVEYKYDNVEDRTEARQRLIDQKVKTLGTYVQLGYNPTNALSFLIGSRYDYIDINGKYTFSGIEQVTKQNLSKFVPRLTGMYNITDNWKLRASYAQGYRAPQSFDEDLHTDVLDGNAIYIELDKNLKAETSNSFNASINFTNRGENNQVNIILEGFYTSIKNKFYDDELSTSPITGVLHRVKINATDMLKVYGINAEANFAFNNKWLWQTNLTLQRSEFDTPQEIGEGKDNVMISSKRVVRTPNAYGSTTLTFTPNTHWSASYTGIFTGKMIVPHTFADQGDITQLTESKAFYEQNIRLAYNFNALNKYNIEFSTGVQNLFNSYQTDFDKGASRDANYIYGPQRPRTFFVGLTCKFN